MVIPKIFTIFHCMFLAKILFVNKENYMDQGHKFQNDTAHRHIDNHNSP
jgi:hypothetical protein